MTEVDGHKAQLKQIFSVGTEILTEPQSETEKIALYVKTETNEPSKYGTKAVRAVL